MINYSKVSSYFSEEEFLPSAPPMPNNFLNIAKYANSQENEKSQVIHLGEFVQQHTPKTRRENFEDEMPDLCGSLFRRIISFLLLAVIFIAIGNVVTLVKIYITLEPKVLTPSIDVLLRPDSNIQVNSTFHRLNRPRRHGYSVEFWSALASLSLALSLIISALLLHMIRFDIFHRHRQNAVRRISIVVKYLLIIVLFLNVVLKWE
ncbi:hypothetical protein ACOME3_004355 [Neoechinorhynchus agilis]